MNEAKANANSSASFTGQEAAPAAGEVGAAAEQAGRRSTQI